MPKTGQSLVWNKRHQPDEISFDNLVSEALNQVIDAVMPGSKAAVMLVGSVASIAAGRVLHYAASEYGVKPTKEELEAAAKKAAEAAQIVNEKIQQGRAALDSEGNVTLDDIENSNLGEAGEIAADIIKDLVIGAAISALIASSGAGLAIAIPATIVANIAAKALVSAIGKEVGKDIEKLTGVNVADEVSKSAREVEKKLGKEFDEAVEQIKDAAQEVGNVLGGAADDVKEALAGSENDNSEHKHSFVQDVIAHKNNHEDDHIH